MYIFFFLAFEVGEAGEHGEPPCQQQQRSVLRLRTVRDHHHQRRDPQLEEQHQRQSTGKDRETDADTMRPRSHIYTSLCGNISNALICSLEMARLISVLAEHN